MTPEEAVAFLSRYLDSEYYTDKCNEAHQIAVEALEKQIPKKPRRTNGGLSIARKNFYTKCQLCNHNIPTVVRDARMKFCPFCGQRLDWSEEQ